MTTTNEPTNTEIKEDTTKLVKEVIKNPSNADLSEEIKELSKALKLHTEGSVEVHTKMYETMGKLATKDDVKNLTRSVAETLKFVKNLNIGIGVFKFSWNNASKIGSFLLLIFGVVLLIKYGIMGVIAWFLPSIK